MKKSILSLLLAVLMLFTMASPAFAAGEDFTFEIKLDKTSVKTGDIVKVSLVIKSSDGQPFEINTMQDYVGYDIEFFEFVEGSIVLPATGNFKATHQGDRVYINRYSMNATTTDSGEFTALTFEVKAINPGDGEFTNSVVEMVDSMLNPFSVKLVDAVCEVEKAEQYVPVVPDNIEEKKYSVKEDSDGDAEAHGEVTLSRTSAKRGTTVRISVEPDEGYEVDKVFVYDEDGDRIKVTNKGDNVFAFEMPKGKVTYTVTYKKVEETEAETDAPETVIPETEAPETEAPETEAPKEPVTPGTTVTPGASTAFTDVDQAQWYREAVDYVVANGYMNGTSATTFDPNGTTTRAMIATILWRLAGSPTTDAAMPFTDVAVGQWYYDAVRWAAAKGIVNGMSPDTFAPNANITREQFAAMLYRYEQNVNGGGYKEGWSYTLNFSDADKVSGWANEALCWCNENKIVNGMGGDLLVPQGNATRAQAAQMLKNFNSRA